MAAVLDAVAGDAAAEEDAVAGDGDLAGVGDDAEDGVLRGRSALDVCRRRSLSARQWSAGVAAASNRRSHLSAVFARPTYPRPARPT